MHIFIQELGKDNIEITSVTNIPLSEDELDHIWDRLSDNTTFGDLRESDDEPERTWKLLPRHKIVFDLLTEGVAQALTPPHMINKLVVGGYDIIESAKILVAFNEVLAENGDEEDFELMLDHHKIEL